MTDDACSDIVILLGERLSRSRPYGRGIGLLEPGARLGESEERYLADEEKSRLFKIEHSAGNVGGGPTGGEQLLGIGAVARSARSRNLGIQVAIGAATMNADRRQWSAIARTLPRANHGVTAAEDCQADKVAGRDTSLMHPVEADAEGLDPSQQRTLGLHLATFRSVASPSPFDPFEVVTGWQMQLQSDDSDPATPRCRSTSHPRDVCSASRPEEVSERYRGVIRLRHIVELADDENWAIILEGRTGDSASGWRFGSLESKESRDLSCRKNPNREGA